MTCLSPLYLYFIVFIMGKEDIDMTIITTLRKKLKGVGFDFENGRIIYQEVIRDLKPGEASDIKDIIMTKYIDVNDRILDRKFNADFGSPNMPRFVAEDNEKIYFPLTYDGATSIGWVYKDIHQYIARNELTPYWGT